MSREIHILHVDDETDFTHSTAAALERMDERLHVEAVTNPPDGLERLADDDFDCLLSAYELPEQTGIEFLQRLREQYPDLPVFLLTSKGSEEVAGDAIANGVTGYLRKQRVREQPTVLASRVEDAVEEYWLEQELDDARSKYRKLVEQNFVGIYIIQDGEFSYVNPKLADIHGYERETILGMSPEELIAPEERDRVQKNLRQRMDGDIADMQYQTVGLTKDGERIDIELHGSRMHYQGAPAVIGVELDITERKQHKRELQRQNERLDEFASVVSHDLQNPLQVAQSRLELARREHDSEHLDKIADAHERMEQLITDLLSLARQGERADETEPVDLAALARSCWQSVETTDATLGVETDRIIRADKSRVRQLLENLFRNAIEQQDGEMTITVGDLDGGFFVADDGPGIASKDREKVFEPGYSTTDDGTGFGLNIVEEIASAHDWEVTIADDDGGARFEFVGVELASE